MIDYSAMAVAICFCIIIFGSYIIFRVLLAKHQGKATFQAFHIKNDILFVRGIFAYEIPINQIKSIKIDYNIGWRLFDKKSLVKIQEKNGRKRGLIISYNMNEELYRFKKEMEKYGLKI